MVIAIYFTLKTRIMNYYLDQEFHEYFKKPISWLPTIGKFNKPYHTIELISIGIVAEDGREYYAVCNEFDLKVAEKNTWLNENVLTPISADFYQKESGYAKYHFSESLTLKNFLKWKGKTKSQIAQDVFEFCTSDTLTLEKAKHYNIDYSNRDISFYGYYADYDWVLFCSLYGTMMDLPKGFPMYCKDLQQIKDDYKYLGSITDNPDGIRKKQSIEEHPNYPKQTNEHNALDDAKWNKELHDFLKS